MRNWLKELQMKPEGPIIIAGFLTFAFLALGATAYLTTDLVTTEPATEPTGFLPLTDLLVVGIALITAWGISVGHRCTDTVVEKYLHRTVILMVLWFLLAILKFVIDDPLAKSLFWYAQCIPLLFIPLVFLNCVLRTASLDNQPGAKTFKQTVAGIAGILCLFAITNNWHHLMFAIDLNDPNWEHTFSYGYLYYPCTALIMFSMIASVILLTISSNRRMRWRVIWIAALFGLGIAYWIIVLLRGLGLQPGNNALAGCMLYVAGIEFCLDLGFFPSAHNHFSLFRNLPFDLKIIAPNGTIAYRTVAARSIDNTTLARLSKLAPKEGAGEVTTRNASTPGFIYKIYQLKGGIALLTEDASEIDKLQAQLEERQHTLANQNEVLSRTHAMQSLLYRQQRERELEERVERDLTATAQQIHYILDNRMTGAGEQAHEERVRQLNLVKVLVAYCKRKGMLALAAADSDTMMSDQLNLIAHETMADLHSVGIECAVLVAVNRPIPISAVNMAYDSFYDCILAVLPQVDPVIMTYISINDKDELVMRATIECAIGIDSSTAVELIPAIATSTESWTAVQTQIARELERRLSVRDSYHTVTLEDGLVVATVKAPAAIPDDCGVVA